MSDLFANNVTGLGTASLLRDLEGLRKALEKLDTLSPEPEATELIEQVKDLVDISGSFNDLAMRERRKPSLHPGSASASDLIHLQSVLEGTAATTEECTVLTRAIQSSLDDIADERNAAGYATHESRLRNQVWYEELRQAFGLHTDVLRALSSAVNTLQFKHDTDEDGNLSPEARSAASTLHYQIALIDPKLNSKDLRISSALRKALSAAKATTVYVPASTNKHFLVVRSSKSFFTGRSSSIATLKAALEDRTHSGQKRFVIYGLAGSGKTELALKYAEERQDSYWGVFFIDGSSRKNASGSYAEIATVGGVEPNERAAKNWLLTRDLPWLLIVDSVDDDEVQLDELLPAGTKGSILITSRNPGHKTYGNVGKRYLELQLMEKDEANELILKAAEEPTPWSLQIENAASAICHALGFLPLALVHAARAILLGPSTWTGYLRDYERHTQQIRRERFRRHSRSRSRDSKQSNRDDDNINVFSSYEILYQSLEASQEQKFQDAVELLHIFSYFHFQNIRLDILISAAINPIKEAKQREVETRGDKDLQKKISKPRPKYWSEWLQEVALLLRGYLDTPAPLPAALKNTDGLSPNVLEDEVSVRLSKALTVLMTRSLVMRQDRIEGRYSMHPLVHKWARERPDTAVAQQALLCQTAITTLAKSILRPPLGETDNERSMRRELRAHIDHARQCQIIIQERLEENRSLIKPFWPVLKTQFGRLQADESARFSRVYSECGLFQEALQLQYKTLEFLVRMLGESHPLTVRVTLIVSGSLWELTRMAEATQLQRRALQVCVDSLGEDHPLTLEVAELLGLALHMKGRWAEALRIHQTNVEKMTNLYGEQHEKTLKSLRSVARLHYRYMEYDRATELHQGIWKGMKKRLGETHLETLICLEDLAMSYYRYEADPPDQPSEQDLYKSHERMQFVLEQRKRILGKEQPYTLLATLYLAQVKAALGQYEEAERMIREGLPIAERNLGEEHTAVLAAKASYARLFIQMGRYEDAEKILRALIDKPQYRQVSDDDGDHPDRIAAIWFLSGCLEKQERYREALEATEEVVAALQKIGGQGQGARHKIAIKAQEKMSELRKRVPYEETSESVST